MNSPITDRQFVELQAQAVGVPFGASERLEAEAVERMEKIKKNKERKKWLTEKRDGIA